MKQPETNLTARQLCALLFLSRIFGLLTFPNTEATTLSAGNGVLIAATYLPFALLLALPALLLFYRGQTPGESAITQQKHPAATKILCVAYAFFFLLQAASAAWLLDSFSGVAMYRNSGHPLLFLCFFALSSITAFSGIHTAARAAPPVLLLFLLTVGLITAATLPYFDRENLSAPEETNVRLLAANGLYAALRTAEPASLLFVWPEGRGRRKSGLPLALCAVGFAGSLLFTLISGVTGAFGETQTFQFYTLTTLAELGAVERMDDLLCALWVFTAMLKTVLYLTLALRSLKIAGQTMETTPQRLLFFAAAWGLYEAIGRIGPLRETAVTGAFAMGAVLLFVAILPSILLLTSLKSKKQREDAV